MGLVSIPDAARALGISRARVHQRVMDGSLPAQQVGHHWVIDEIDLPAVAHHAGPGRPLSPTSAWALIAADAGQIDHPSPAARSRARARHAQLLRQAPRLDLDDFAARMHRTLGNRAERTLYRASPLDLPGLRDDPRLHRSGLSAPQARISADGIVEGYLHPRDHQPLVREHLLTPATGPRANVIMHIITTDADVEHLLDRDLLVAADLAEHATPRERARAQELLADLARRHDL